MTNELAIRILTGDVLGTTEQTQEAVTMAVRSLSQPDVTDTNVGNTINRQAAVDALVEWYGCEPSDMDYFVKILAKQPSAEKTGTWEPITRDAVQCSNCHKYWTWTFNTYEINYCPNCGARMVN